MALIDVLAQIDAAEDRLRGLKDSAHVPDEPDRAWVDAWLHRSHLAHWNRAAS